MPNVYKKKEYGDCLVRTTIRSWREQDSLCGTIGRWRGHDRFLESFWGFGGGDGDASVCDVVDSGSSTLVPDGDESCGGVAGSGWGYTDGGPELRCEFLT